MLDFVTICNLGTAVIVEILEKGWRSSFFEKKTPDDCSDPAFANRPAPPRDAVVFLRHAWRVKTSSATDAAGQQHSRRHFSSTIPRDGYEKPHPSNCPTCRATGRVESR
jgi:hypothetical protein